MDPGEYGSRLDGERSQFCHPLKGKPPPATISQDVVSKNEQKGYVVSFSQLLWIYIIFRTIQDTAGAQKYKRYQLCRELFMSEINCLKAIDFLIRVGEILTPAPVKSRQNKFLLSSFIAFLLPRQYGCG